MQNYELSKKNANDCTYLIHYLTLKSQNDCLINMYEGLVPIRDMKDFFHFDEDHMTLTGERSHIKYSIGERVIVKVVRASKEDQTIDFEIVRKV